MGDKNFIRRIRYFNIGNWWKTSYDFCKECRVSTDFAYSHILLPSKDEGYVTYFSSVNKLLKDNQDGKGIRTKTTLGRFLKKFSKLSDNEIRVLAEAYNAKFKQEFLFFIPNTDPDGWEAVYENAWGFSSCMMYNTSHNTYLDDRCHGEYRPVRAFAHSENNLALAYTANREWAAGDNSELKIYARVIVNTQTKTFLEIYGDSSVIPLLELAGYTKNSSTTDGQKLVRLMLNDEEIICPQIDGYQDQVRDFGNHLMVVNDGMDTSSSGIIRIGWTCPHCGYRHLNEENIFEVSGGDELRCNECVRDTHVWGYSEYGKSWIEIDSAIPIDDTYYTELEAKKFGYHYSHEYNEWIYESGVTFTSRGVMRLSDPNLVKLALPCPEECDYAHIDDTTPVQDSDGVEYIVHKGTNLANHDLFGTNPFNQESENRKAS